jgi:hypothetical protein
MDTQGRFSAALFYVWAEVSVHLSDRFSEIGKLGRSDKLQLNRILVDDLLALLAQLKESVCDMGMCWRLADEVAGLL